MVIYMENHEDSSTELTSQSRKKAIIRGAMNDSLSRYA